MNRIVYPLAAAIALAVAAPVMAAGFDCKKDIVEFDAAVKTTTASQANVERAMRLRKLGAKDCAEKGRKIHGDANLDAALALIGARK